MSEKEKDKWVRLKPETHLKLMSIKDVENYPTVDALVQNLVAHSSGTKRVTLTVGTVEVWSRSV